jgi:hypothetical protein
MALTANTLPSAVPYYATPFDAQNAMASAQTLVATGYMTNQLDIGAGRVTGMWATDFSALDVSSGDETYRFFLLGSNDVAWGNGNVEVLTFFDIAAATAGRIIATILGASPAIPMAGRAGMLQQKPFNNLSLGIVYRYVRGYAVIGGTTPTVTLTSWLSDISQ